jgi:tetratricopeptide (TPR) repeat protein
MNKLLILGLLTFAISCGDKKSPDNPSHPLTALDSITRKIALEPKNHSLLANRAKMWIERGEFREAKIDIGKAILLDSTIADYYPIMADVYMGLKQPAGCRVALEKCIQVNPNHLLGLNKLATFNLFLRDYKKTIELADRALKVDVHNARSYFIKGFAFMESGDTSKAISSFQTATEQDPDYYEAYLHLGQIFAAKHSKLAVNYFGNAANIRPKSTEVYYDLALFYQDNNQIPKAVETYTNLLKLDSAYSDAHYNLGYISFKFDKKYEEAIAHFTQAITFDRKMAKAAYMRGLCYEALKQIDKAKAQYMFAIQVDSSFELAVKANNRLLGQR